MATSPISAALFYDWQNVNRTARHAFGWSDTPNEYGHFSPYQLAPVLAVGNGRGTNGRLCGSRFIEACRRRGTTERSPAANRR